jgi:hypothetical protein
MKVCEESIHAFNLLPGVNVNVCIAIEWSHSDTIWSIASSGFEGAQTGRADSDDASSTGIDFVCCLLGHVDVLSVHRVFCDVIRAFDWAKCSKANGEENACSFDAICGESIEELCGEVEACGWGGCAPGHSVVDRLVTLTVI